MSESRQRPYRSRKQKPCNLCRKRKICCIRIGEGPCQLCELRNVTCVVEKEGLVSKVLQTVKTIGSYEAFGVTDSSVSLKRPTSLNFVGLSGDFDPFVLRHRQWPKSEASHSTAWQCERVGKAPISPVYFTTSPSPYHLRATSPRRLEDLLNEKQNILMKAYFEHVHYSYPLLATREPEINLGDHELLTLSLCFIAKPFCPSSNNLNEEALAAHIYTLLVDEASHGSLDTIEAFLIFSQRHGYAERFPGSPGNSLEAGIVSQVEERNAKTILVEKFDRMRGLYTRQIVTMAHNLGLNMNSRTWDIPPLEKKRRKRLWWAVYIHDKWSASALGRPSLIDDSHMDVDPLLASDFMENDGKEGETGTPLQHRIFISMASLSIILSDILNTFYTINAKQEWLTHQSPEYLYIEYARLGQLLKSWEEKSLIPLLEIRAYPDPLGSIVLAYHTLQAILYRAVLLKLERLEADSSLILNNAFVASSDDMSLVQNLTISQMSALWWPFSHASLSTIGSFMLSRFLSSTQPESAERWAAQFAEYRKLLRSYAPTFPVARYAVSSLTALAEQS